MSTEGDTNTSNAAVVADQVKIDYGTVLRSTAELYASGDQFSGVRWSLREVDDLLGRDRWGRPKILADLPTGEARFELYARCSDALERIPFQLLKRAKLTLKATLFEQRPMVPERKWIVGQLLDVLGIAAGENRTAYASAAAFELGNLRCSLTDDHLGLPDWMPVPCMVHAARRIAMTSKETYGRPPPLWELVEKCRDSRVELHHILQGIDEIGRSWLTLHHICKATEDAFCIEE